VADNILQEWQLRLKASTSNSDEDFSRADDGFADDGFSDMELSPAGLQSTLESGYGLENAQIPKFDPDDNPSAAAVLDAVAHEFPLNRKQGMVAERIIQGALAWKDHPYDCSKRDQLLTYIGGGGGTGESRIIKAIVAAMRILRREHEVILVGPTGAAADNIG
jgi:hypothetical protein